MFKFSFKVNRKKVDKAVGVLSALPVKRILPVLNQWRMRLYDTIVREKLSGDPINTRPEGRIRRMLKQAFLGTSFQPKGQDLSMTVGVPIALAKQEEGGVIAPKEKDYLTIPLPMAFVGGGQGEARPLSSFDDTFVLKGRPGRQTKLVMWQKTETEAVPIYILAKSVKLPARPWFEDGVKAALPELQQMLKEAR